MLGWVLPEWVQPPATQDPLEFRKILFLFLGGNEIFLQGPQFFPQIFEGPGDLFLGHGKKVTVIRARVGKKEDTDTFH